MNKQLLHSEEEVKKLDLSLGVWYYNIPFEAVPKGFIEQLSEHPYTHEEYLEQCPLLNELPNYWNLALMDDESQIIAFVWGNFDPLEKSMQVIRITILPRMFRIDGDFLYKVVKIIKQFAQEMKLERVYWITNKWKALLRKLPGVVFVSNTAVMEVY